MAHVIEAAVTGRAKCRGCGVKIAAGERRFGERVPNAYGEDGTETTHWFHPACAAFRRPEAFVQALEAGASLEGVEHGDFLAHEAALGAAHRRLSRASTAERAPTGRAACRACKNAIDKDAWRIGLLFYDDGRFAPSGFIHAACAAEYFETTEVLPRVKHFSPELTPVDLDEIAAAIGAPR